MELDVLTRSKLQRTNSLRPLKKTIWRFRWALNLDKKNTEAHLSIPEQRIGY